MIVPNISCLARSQLISSLTKNTASGFRYGRQGASHIVLGISHCKIWNDLVNIFPADLLLSKSTNQLYKKLFIWISMDEFLIHDKLVKFTLGVNIATLHFQLFSELVGVPIIWDTFLSRCSTIRKNLPQMWRKSCHCRHTFTSFHSHLQIRRSVNLTYIFWAALAPVDLRWSSCRNDLKNIQHKSWV